MTPILLQNFLIKELTNLFANDKFKNANKEMVSLNIYPQYLPQKTGKKDKDHLPYLIISLEEGSASSIDDPSICNITIVFGGFDDTSDYQGYRDAFNVIYKIKQHFLKKIVFDNKYEIKYPIKWKLPEEDTYPYFFGGLFTNWNIGKATIEEDEFV